MKKYLAYTFCLMFLIFSLSGCYTVGERTASLVIIYEVAAAVSFVLLIGCILLVHKKNFWYLLLFFSVLVVNCGYAFLALSPDLDTALQANRIAYLGSAFLPPSMLMIILDVTNTKYKKYLPAIFFGIATVVFLIAASPGVLDVYYKEVLFEKINGVSVLVKTYGPLHPTYLFYLLSSFVAMIVVIMNATFKKRVENIAYAIVLNLAVFVNIGVWFIGQMVDVGFEMLSVSYIISEMFLLGIHIVMRENQRLRAFVKQVENAQKISQPQNDSADVALENPLETTVVDSSRIEMFVNGLGELTATEKAVYDAYIARLTTKEVMAKLNIKENTLKFHNKNLYSKLGISSRKELLEIYKCLKSAKPISTDAKS